jgi:hypothetical protein
MPAVMPIGRHRAGIQANVALEGDAARRPGLAVRRRRMFTARPAREAARKTETCEMQAGGVSSIEVLNAYTPAMWVGNASVM